MRKGTSVERVRIVASEYFDPRNYLLFGVPFLDPRRIIKGGLTLRQLWGKILVGTDSGHQEGRVKIMPRKPADLRISIKRRGGRT